MPEEHSKIGLTLSGGILGKILDHQLDLVFHLITVLTTKIYIAPVRTYSG
jgi:hypothetical protein